MVQTDTALETEASQDSRLRKFEEYAGKLNMIGGQVDLYRGLGSDYESLPKELRTPALRKVLAGLDKIPVDYVRGEKGNGHTPYIGNPFLFSDIVIARPHYCPDFVEGRELVKGDTDFARIRERVMDENGRFNHQVRNGFIVAVSLLKSPFGGQYVEEAERGFLGKVVYGLVGMRLSRAENDEIPALAEGVKKELPASLHKRLDKIVEASRNPSAALWVNPKDFIDI